MITPEPGQIVRVRARQYLVETVVPPARDADQTLVGLACVDDDAQGDRLRVLWEREPDARILGNTSWEVVSRRGFDTARRFAAYLHAQRWNCVTSTTPRLFQSPHRAGIKIEPYQLEPLRKALQLPRVNLFIADDVGLGKTIEAGLILRELLMRQRVQRVVVACPPSVVLQWKDELSTRFGLEFVVFDRDFVQRRRRERGWTLNPWTTHARFIISHALLRDEDYAAPLRDWLGDGRSGALFILDEAHNAAPAGRARYAVDSRLTRVVREIAPLFEHRLFLSATPHNGHSNSFAALLEILDPQRFCRGVPVRSAALLGSVMVRRLKSDLRAVGGGEFPTRQVLQIDIHGLASDAPELDLARLLDAYRDTRELGLASATRAVQNAASLVVVGLQKRLLSSIEAFARTLIVHRDSVRRRRRESDGATAGTVAPPTDASQLQLGLVLDAPGADDTDTDRSETDLATSEAEQFAAASDLATVELPAPMRAREDALLDQMTAIAQASRHLPDPRVVKLVGWIRENLCPTLGAPEGSPPPAWLDRRVIVFTEFTDTKNYLLRCLREAIARTDRADSRIAAFHGGMDDEAREAIKRAFNADPGAHPLRILVATDAAREGVNLQNHCADLFHFDVPWNPSRMEQRNGRIDRKLQRAKIVRCHYFVFTQRPEDDVLRALVVKTANIRTELGSLSEVLEGRLADALQGGIRRSRTPALTQTIEQMELFAPAPAPAGNGSGDGGGEPDDLPVSSQATLQDELESSRANVPGLQKQLLELEDILDASRDALKISPERLEQAVACALDILGGAAMEPLGTTPGTGTGTGTTPIAVKSARICRRI